MNNYIKAALQGPELKGVKIKGHEFNVKPVSYRVRNGELTILGQISHCLALRADDQVWYTFRKKAGVVSPSDTQRMIIKKQDGGVIKTIQNLKGVISIIAAIYGVNADSLFEQLNNHSSQLGFLDFDGDWENVVRSFLLELSAAALIPAAVSVSGLQLYQDPNMRGSSILIKTGQQVTNTSALGWNDKASSFIATVPEGSKLTLFRDSNYGGNPLEFGPGFHAIYDMNIHDFNDAVSSIRWDTV